MGTDLRWEIAAHACSRRRVESVSMLLGGAIGIGEDGKNLEFEKRRVCGAVMPRWRNH